MKTETKQRIWAEVINQLNNQTAGGKNFQLKFSGNDYRVGIKTFNGQWWTMPEHILEQLTGQAKDFIESEKAKAKAKTAKWIEAHRKEREELDKRLDEDGFTLLAGEDTDVICQGTLRQCRDNLWKVLKCRRDPYVGKGCYVIVDSENIEVQSGEFDKDCVY